MFKKSTLTTLLVSLVFCVFARDFKADALTYLKQNKKQFNLSDQDIADLKVTYQYTDDDKANITHIWFQQTAYGIGLYNSEIAIHLNNKGEIAYSTGEGVLDFRTKINTPSSAVSITKAIGIASKLTAGKEPADFKQIDKLADGRLLFDKIEGVTNDPVYVRQVYFTENNTYKLGWEVTIETIDHQHSWSYHLDASSGRLIKQVDNVLHEARPDFKKYFYSNNNSGGSSGFANRSSNTTSTQSTLSVPETSSYRVFPYYTEAPTFGPRVLINNPADSLPSPFGWNDTNGAAGAEGTLTTGNNVDAYTDKDANDVADVNSRPNATASLAFDFPLDLTQRTDTLANVKAAVAQLYYLNNIMHDISYRYGFNEAAGNYQKNNYSRGGSQNDFVKAEALDGSGTDNANFQPGADGTSGRMQMYMWPVLSRPLLIINAPAAIKDTDFETAKADFGPCSFNVTGTCVVANDGSANPSYACNAIVNFAAMNGKIAIVDRNDCNFYDKVLNCQDAGAIGVIVVNRVDSLLGGMALPAGDDANAITIPSIFILKSVGDALKAHIATLNVTLYSDPADCNIPAFNGCFDNAVMAHEYGHGISTRMTGHATNPNCLLNAEEGGEGWSDFFGLAVTHKPTDTRNTARGIGTYVVGEQPTDGGIRNYPYSTDMSVNPLTYADMGGALLGTEVHNIGEILCVTLWEMYWNLIDTYGYSSDLYRGTAGNNRAIKLVIAGFTYQGCSPGYVDVRNGILKADSILYGKADYCDIWRAFAKRGLGAGAKEGSTASATDQTAAFDLPASCTGATASFTASDTTVCAGGTLTFTNTSTASTGSPDSVRWTIPGGVPSTSTSTTTVTPVFSTPGTYVISLVAYKTGLPSAAATKSIRVKAKPTVGVNSPTICSGNTATLTATGATTYSWTGGLAATSPVTTPALTSTTTYTVTGTTSGCTGTATATITVTPNPTVGVNSPTICSGTTATLTASGATTYTWTGGLAATSPVTTPTLTNTTTYTVTGTTSGCTGTAVATVTVTPLPPVAVNSPGICSGNTATLTATGASSYTWTGGLAATSPVTTPTLTTTTTYTVTGTTGSCSKTAVATVTVTAVPTVGVNSPTICSGQTATLTATGATSYTWTGGLAATSPVTTPTLTNTTTYTVTGTTNGCTGTAVATVTVNPSPPVGVNSPTICSGQTATLTATGATTYSWTGGLAATSPVTTPALTSTTTYTVTGTASGCTATAVATVTVTPLPNITVNSPSICSGSTATLTANGASNGYVWSTLATTQSITVSPTSTTTYTVTGTTGSCSKTVTSTVTVTSSTPTVTIASNPTPPSICLGDPITLTASGADSYIWDQSGAVGNVLTFTPTGNITVHVSGTLAGCSSAGVAQIVIATKPKPTVGVNSPTICSGQTASLSAVGADTYAWTGGLSSAANVTTPVLTSTNTYTVTGTTDGCTGTATSTVTVKPLPNTALTASSNGICSGDSVVLNASGADTYSWSPSGSGTSQTVTPVSTVTYVVTGTTDGCTKSASQTITVTSPPATPSITQSGDTLYSSVIVVGANYRWYRNDTLVATTSTPSYHLSSAGNYTIKVDDNNCLSAASAIFAATFTGIRNSSNSIRVFEIYPNPTEGSLTMNLNLTKVSTVQITIFSPEGRELYIKVYPNTKTVFDQLNISQFAKGVYIIKLNVDNEIYYHKVVKD